MAPNTTFNLIHPPFSISITNISHVQFAKLDATECTKLGLRYVPLQTAKIKHKDYIIALDTKTKCQIEIWQYWFRLFFAVSSNLMLTNFPPIR